MDLLQNPLVLAVIVIALVVVVALLLLIRRRQAAEDVAPPPEIGEAIDYTSLPYEEPQGLADRFQRAPAAVKALLVLVPLAILGVLAALALTLFQPGQQNAVREPIGPPPEISDVVAEVAGAGKIVVRASTTAPDGTQVTAQMTQADQDFPWFNPETAATTASAGRITLQLDRTTGAPIPQQGTEYNVVVVARLPDGREVRSQSTTVTVLPTFAADFYGQTPAAIEPTTAPTDAPAAPTATAEPAAEPTPDIAATPPLTATVRNGGNIRQQPTTASEILGQVAPGETVDLLSRSADGQWYRLRGAAAEGWVSATLLAVDPAVAEQVQPEIPADSPTARVFNGGNVRAAPNLSGEVLDQINAGEEVQMLARNDPGSWILIVNPRQITGWVSRTLLEVSLEGIRGLQVSNDPVAAVPPAATAAPDAPAPDAPAPSGLTAQVFNGGNVRAAPNLGGEVQDQINAGEEVQLLGKTADGGWYQITNPRGVTGWVNRTLLTVDPEVARRVPVAE
jgi:flagellar FliL protein